MKCKEASSLAADWLTQSLSADDARRLSDHLESCRSCRDEADAIALLWGELGEADDPVPSERLRTRFHAALAAYEHRARRTPVARFIDWMQPGSVPLLAGTGAALLVVGILIGRGLSDATGEIDELRREVRAMSVALLDHQSASERLSGVAGSARSASGTPVANALLDVLRNDRSVNVRLAAVEALGAWADQPDVASALLDALVMEEAPLLQVALVELLLQRNAGNATAIARQLLESGNLDPMVREYVRTSLGDIEIVNAPDAA